VPTKEEKQLTVAELITELQKFPADMLVWTEGCDCFGKASGAVRYSDDGIAEHDYVLVTRRP